MTTLPNITSGVDPLTGLLIFLVAVFGGTISANSISDLLSKVWKKRHRKVADADERAEKMLELAREESLAIIKSAHEQARKILAETGMVSSQINDLAHSAIQTSMKEKSKLLEDSLVKLQEQFAISLGGIQSDYINRYKKAIKTIAEAETYFGSRVDFYLSGGRKKGNPSTLISLATKKPTLLRGELSKRVTSLFLSGEQMGEAR
jgi:vacuolar-type H+-ATPase subunit H